MTIKTAVEILKKHLGAAAFGRSLEKIVQEVIEAVNQPERETGYYWVRHTHDKDGSGKPILFWNGSAWYHGTDIYKLPVTPVSGRLSPPVLGDTWTTSAKHPDASIHPVIYINKNETEVRPANASNVQFSWCWRYATDWTAFKPGDVLPDKPGFVMLDTGRTVKVDSVQHYCSVIAYKVTDA